MSADLENGEQAGDDPRPWARPGAVRRDCAPHRGRLLLWLARAGVVCGALAFLLWFPGLAGVALGLAVWVSAGRDLR